MSSLPTLYFSTWKFFCYFCVVHLRVSHFVEILEFKWLLLKHFAISFEYPKQMSFVCFWSFWSFWTSQPSEAAEDNARAK